MDAIRSNPLITAAAAAGLGAVGLRFCCLARNSGSRGAPEQRTRAVALADNTETQNYIQVTRYLEGNDCGFRLDIPSDWQVDEEDQHGARVFKFKKENTDAPETEAGEEGPEEQPVLLILEKLTEEVSVEKYAETAKEGTVAQLERLGDVTEVKITDRSLMAGSGKSQKHFVQWQLRLKSDPQEDADNYNDHGEPEAQDPINMWSGVCIHGGYAWAFQICGGHGFEEMLDQARKIARSLQFTNTKGR